MATKLTTFSKLLITLLILALIVAGGWYLLNKTSLGEQLKENSEKIETTTKGTSSSSKSNESKSNTNVAKGDDVLNVQLVSWGGYAPGLYFNEGAAANTRSRFYKDYGFKVNFILDNDLINAMNAWMAEDYDVLVQTADAFPFYTAPDDLKPFKPRAFMQVDWSRGGDAIIVKRGINTINDLKGKKVAVAVPSPAQTLLITALEAAGLSYSDVTAIETQDNIVSAQSFKSADVDAAVVWSPDDILATRDVPGSKILLTTRQQSHIIGDIMFASEDYIIENKEMINQFYEGWMKGLAEINANPGNMKKAAKYLAEFNDVAVEDAEGMIDNVYLTNHGDNVNFFGLNPQYKGQKGSDLYNKMAQKFVDIKALDKMAPTWRSIAYSGAIQQAQSKLVGARYEAEKPKEFERATPAETVKPAIASRPASINFASGQYLLSENAKSLIDLQFAGIAKSFANARIRIEGNTDNVGGKQMNIDLSRKRAQSVANYLASEYGMDIDRFVITGNGPDKPIPGCETNATEACKAKNRRTEFQLIAD